MPFCVICKIGGAVCLLIALVGAGASLAAKERRRAARAAGFLTLLRHVRAQIAAFSLPIPAILSQCDEKLLFLVGAGANAARTDLVDLVRNARADLSDTAAETLTSWAEEIGRGDRAEDLRKSDLAIEKMESIVRKESAESRKREKLALFLPPLLGGIVICLLI